MKKKRLLKMQELSLATGVSGGTIRYYVRKGILPKPLKTHRNMAYYDESYIERIREIKELQKKRYLPLNIIKMILESREFTLDAEQRELLQEIEKPLFEKGRWREQRGPMSKEELSAHTGLPPEDIEALESMGMLEPDEEGRFDGEGIQLAEIVGEVRRIGLTKELDFRVEHLQTHLDLMEFLARKEIEIFTKRMVHRGIDPRQIANLVQEAVEALDQMLSILHRRMIRRITAELK